MRPATFTLALLALLLAALPAPRAEGPASDWVGVELYLIDYAYVVHAENCTEANFEMPVNYSDDSLCQRVYVELVGGNASVTSAHGQAVVKISMGSGVRAFMVLRIELAFKNVTGALERADLDPTAFKLNATVPANVAAEFIREPHRLVKDVVKKDFEAWLGRVYGVSPSEASNVFVAIKAAEFVFRHYITYNASALPRTLEEVIKSRQGDCDDMSRVLMSLLWSYGIPAKIEYSYVYLPMQFTMPIERSYMVFEDTGPHGYVVAYLPPLGWTSLDFLAGARLNYPSVVTSYSTRSDVTREEIEEVREFNRQNLYAELVLLTTAEGLRERGVNLSDGKSVEEYALRKLEPYVSLLESLVANETAAEELPVNVTVGEPRIEPPAQAEKAVEAPPMDVAAVLLVMTMLIAALLTSSKLRRVARKRAARGGKVAGAALLTSPLRPSLVPPSCT